MLAEGRCQQTQTGVRSTEYVRRGAPHRPPPTTQSQSPAAQQPRRSQLFGARQENSPLLCSSFLSLKIPAEGPSPASVDRPSTKSNRPTSTLSEANPTQTQPPASSRLCILAPAPAPAPAFGNLVAGLCSDSRTLALPARYPSTELRFGQLPTARNLTTFKTPQLERLLRPLPRPRALIHIPIFEDQLERSSCALVKLLH